MRGFYIRIRPGASSPTTDGCRSSALLLEWPLKVRRLVACLEARNFAYEAQVGQMEHFSWLQWVVLFAP